MKIKTFIEAVCILLIVVLICTLTVMALTEPDYNFEETTYKVESGIATAEGYSYEINAKVMLRRLNAKVRGTRSGDAIEGTLTAPMGSITFNGNKSR